MVLINPYLAPFKPVNNITPFTYRDGVTYLEILESLSFYVQNTLVDYVNENFTNLGNEFEIEVNRLITDINAALETQSEENAEAATALTEYVNGVVETINAGYVTYTAEIDGKIAEVTEDITDFNTFVTTEVANLTTYVNAQVATIIGESATLNDETVAALVTTSSDTQDALDARYGSSVFNDPALAAIINDDVSLSRAALDALYGDETVDDSSLAALINDTETITRTLLNDTYAPIGTAELLDTTIAGLDASIDSRVDSTIDDKVAAKITTPGTDVKAALDATYAPKLQVLACTARRVNSTTWEIYNDATHQPIGTASIVITGSNRLTLTYNFVATKVHTFQVTLDESFAATNGLRVGASVGLSTAVIYFYTAASGSTPVNPGDLSTSNANIWIYGLFTV